MLLKGCQQFLGSSSASTRLDGRRVAVEEQRRAAVAAQRLSVGAGRGARPDAAAAQPGQQSTEPLDGAHLPPKR